MCKSSIFSLFKQLYKAKVPIGSGENFPDLTKIILIRNPAYRTAHILCSVGV